MDALDQAIAAAATPGEQRAQARIPLPPGPDGAPRVAGLDVPVPFETRDVLAVTVSLLQLSSQLQDEAKGPASRIILPG